MFVDDTNSRRTLQVDVQYTAGINLTIDLGRVPEVYA